MSNFEITLRNFRKCPMNKSGKHRIATVMVLVIIVFMALILAYAPDSDSVTGGSIADNGITGGSTANQITGHAVFSFPSGLDTTSGMMGITGFDVADDFFSGPGSFTHGGVNCVQSGGEYSSNILCDNGVAFARNADNNGWVTSQEGIGGEQTFADGSEFADKGNEAFESTQEPEAPEGEAAAPGEGEEEEEEEEEEEVASGSATGESTESTISQESLDDQARLTNVIADMGLDSAGYEYTAQPGMGNGYFGNEQARITDDGGVSVNIGGTWVHQGSGAGLLSVLSGPVYYDDNNKVVTLTPEQRSQFRQHSQEVTRVRGEVAKQPGGRTYYEKIQMNQQYQRTRIQFTGRLSGWLSGMISSGQIIPGIDGTKVGPGLNDAAKNVPGLICQNAYGLSYDQGSSWIRSVQPNATPWMAQAQLMENARIATINGEKEEIIDHLFRYAYSLRLLGDTSVEWETYLKNSCTNVRSDDAEGGFYDYGHLGMGQHYYMHFAGSSGQDMIFNCEIEECIFDQACVQFIDEPAPYCVPLVNGAGFRTVDAGAYGCWDPERTYDEFRNDIEG
jgi:hypothetical protein